MTIERSNAWRDDLVAAVLSAYTERKDLEGVLWSALGLNLNEIVPESYNLRDIIVTLLQWAHAHGRWEEILRALVVNRPARLDLHATVDRALSQPSAPWTHPTIPGRFGSASQSDERVLSVRVHRAYFLGHHIECYFINLTNLSPNRVLEVTHVWYEDEGRQISVAQRARQLPARLDLDQSWETWIEIDVLPEVHRENAFDMFRARTSDGTVFRSERNNGVPEMGTVPGGPISQM